MALIQGTSGADTLSGGPSGNVMTGAAGNDIFVYQRAQTDTTVTDFGSTYFAATLTGQQEVPANPSAATGTFTGELNRARTQFAFTTTVTGLDLGAQTQATADNVVAAHFHAGPPGANAGVVFGFIGTPNNDVDAVTDVNPTTGVVTSEWHLNEGNATTLTAQVPNLLANNMYINFHTVPLPGGEIRGQVIAVDTGGDKIDLRDAHIGDMETLSFALRPLGNSTLITTLQNGVASNMVLQGVSMGSLTANDFIFADTGSFVASGNAGADDMFGTAGSDSLNGVDGNDRLIGARGSDSLDGGAGNDTLLAGGDADSVFGGLGNDSIQANDGADSVSGGDGTDIIFGGKGSDSLYGDAGNDTLSGDLGIDIMVGGAGADRFAFRAGFGNDWVADFNFAEGDRVMLSTGATFTMTAFQNQVLLTLSTGDVIGLAGVPAASFTNEFVVFG